VIRKIFSATLIVLLLSIFSSAEEGSRVFSMNSSALKALRERVATKKFIVLMNPGVRNEGKGD
jgi:hypothetical protein